MERTGHLGDCDAFDEMQSEDGEGFEVKVPESLKGIELRDKVRDHLPIKAGARVLFWHAESGSSSSKMLSPSKTLKEQGLTGENARFSLAEFLFLFFDPSKRGQLMEFPLFCRCG